LSNHLSQNQVGDYCRLQLRPAELLSVSDHLGECESCRRLIECAMNGDAAFLALRSEVFGEAAEIISPPLVRENLSPEQAAGYVDGNLAGEELQMVADHLTSCERCSTAVDDLRLFKTQIASSLDREYSPAPVQARPVLASHEGWLRRTIVSLAPIFGGYPRVAFGTALTVLLVAMGSWLIWRAPEEQAPKQEVVVTPTPPTLPTPSPSPAPLVAQLNDGKGQLSLDREGNLSGAEDLPPVYQSLLKEALTAQRIAKSPQLKGLTRPPSSLMGADTERNEFVVIEPLGKVLITDRPTFRWSNLVGATSYVVEIYDEKFNLVAASSQIVSNSWRAPQQLGRGEVFSWQVKALKDGQEFTSPRPPAPQAKFRILDQAKANELAKARRAYESSHLTLGLLYAEAGLLREAEQELRALQKANPGSAVARSLLSQIQALRR
jgi:putative zinc finger protein